MACSLSYERNAQPQLATCILLCAVKTAFRTSLNIPEASRVCRPTARKDESAVLDTSWGVGVGVVTNITSSKNYILLPFVNVAPVHEERREIELNPLKTKSRLLYLKT